MNQVQSAEDGRVNNNQAEHRNHNMPRPWFLRGKPVSDERHKDSDDGDERRSDVQAFITRNSLAAHDMWPDIANREEDRQIHANGCQSRKPGQDSDRKRSL